MGDAEVFVSAEPGAIPFAGPTLERRGMIVVKSPHHDKLKIGIANIEEGSLASGERYRSVREVDYPGKVGQDPGNRLDK
jgi:hypothetical protein